MEHYKAIAPKTATFIFQIRRDFNAGFSNDIRYLDAAERKFAQPTHHARKIMELGELYDDGTLHMFIGTAMDEDKMDIRSFRALFREYNSGLRQRQAGRQLVPSAYNGAMAGPHLGCLKPSGLRTVKMAPCNGLEYHGKYRRDLPWSGRDLSATLP